MIARRFGHSRVVSLRWSITEGGLRYEYTIFMTDSMQSCAILKLHTTPASVQMSASGQQRSSGAQNKLFVYINEMQLPILESLSKRLPDLVLEV
jgi:hypothetical protein